MMEEKTIDQKDMEISVGENKISLGKDNILYGVFAGNVDAETATAIGEATLKLLDLAEGRVDILDDISIHFKLSFCSFRSSHSFSANFSISTSQCHGTNLWQYRW